MNSCKLHCLFCKSDEQLQMYAHRTNDGKMVGWIFLCTRCATLGKHLKVGIQITKKVDIEKNQELKEIDGRKDAV